MPHVKYVQVVKSHGDKGVICSIRGRAHSKITAAVWEEAFMKYCFVLLDSWQKKQVCCCRHLQNFFCAVMTNYYEISNLGGLLLKNQNQKQMHKNYESLGNVSNLLLKNIFKIEVDHYETVCAVQEVFNRVENILLSLNVFINISETL